MIRPFLSMISAMMLTVGGGVAQAAIHDPVMTQSGLVQGVSGTTSGSEVFKAIPYAAPPVGDLRWRPPAPAPRWQGVRRADAFAPDCTPLSPQPDSRAPGSSEDCLYLNVWTPAKAPGAKLPVMVWIDGGGFTGGSATAPRYDGAGLNRKGVILVSLNYRTGVLGFLSHPLLARESAQAVSGNYGLLDMVAALKWVCANIAQFGGDPGRVTIFGQSSGSESVNILTASPLAKGLFQRAIGESGGSFGERQPKSLAGAQAAGASYAAQFGDTLQELRAKPAAVLLAAAKPGDFEPVVDGWVLPVDVHDLLAAGRQNDVPILVGSNADEMQLSARADKAAYEQRVRARFGAHAGEVLNRFPATTDAEARLALKTVWTLLLGDYNTSSWATAKARSGKSAVFQYRFVHAPPPASPPAPGSPSGPSATGAFHGAEIIYAFNNQDAQDRAWTGEDRRLAEIISSYWVNFAKTGNPNGPGLPRWPTVQAEPSKVLEFGDLVQTVTKPNADAIRFLDSVFYGPGGVYR